MILDCPFSPGELSRSGVRRRACNRLALSAAAAAATQKPAAAAFIALPVFSYYIIILHLSFENIAFSASHAPQSTPHDVTPCTSDRRCRYNLSHATSPGGNGKLPSRLRREPVQSDSARLSADPRGVVRAREPRQIVYRSSPGFDTR